MPAIHLFHRRTILGGDDLQPSAVLGIMVRTVQLLGLLVPIWVHISLTSKHVGGFIDYIWYDPSSDSSCRHSHFFPLLLVCYAAASTIHVLVGMGLEQRVYHWSSVGTPTEPQPRSKHVEHLLEFKMVPFTIAQALIVVMGVTALAYAGRYHKCARLNPNMEQDDFFLGDDASQNQADNNEREYIWGPLAWWAAYFILLFSQFVQVVIRCSYLCRLLRLPQAHAIRAGPESQQQWNHHELAEEMWANRCNNFCQSLSTISCYLFGGRDVALGDYGAVARALADFFESGGILDLVPSDLVMGFLVLHRIQRMRVLEARQQVQEERNQLSFKETSLRDSDRESSHHFQSILLPVGAPTTEVEEERIALDHSFTPTELEFEMKRDGSLTYYQPHSRKVLSRRHPFDLEILREGAHFSRYALAIYTWVLYVYMHPITGIPKLLSRSLCCSSMEEEVAQHGYSPPPLNPSSSDEGCHCMVEDEYGGIMGDNCCDIHKNALLLHLQSEEADLVYAQLRSSFTEIPYCIVLDHKWKTVVLSIRGTFSLEDCVTDVLIDPEPLDDLGNEHGFQAEGEYTHGGVFACARALYGDLQRHGILDRLLLGENAKYGHYKLRVVGHSLGAATGTLISMMIRQRFPTLRCLNFSPPGGSFSWGFARGCQDFCTSFVLDCDLVPRLSRDSMEFLRNEVLEIIGRVKVPKMEATGKAVSGTGLFSWRLCQDGDLEEDGAQLRQTISDVLHDRADVPPDSEYQLQLQQFQDVQTERRSRRGALRAVSLYPPGRIVHLVKTGERRSFLNGIAKCLTLCTTNAGSEYTPVFAKNDDFNEIVVSPTMGTDHFPNRVCLELEGVAAAYGLDTTMPGMSETALDV